MSAFEDKCEVACKKKKEEKELMVVEKQDEENKKEREGGFWYHSETNEVSSLVNWATPNWHGALKCEDYAGCWDVQLKD